MKNNNLIGGIYKIEDVETGNVYVGSADSDTGIKKRWSWHLAKFRNDGHYYTEFQEAWDDGHENRIKFEILEECDDDELEERENYWIQYCKKVDGWTVINKQKKASRKGKVGCTKNMRIAQQGENNGNARLSEKEAKEIIKMKNDRVKHKEIADKFGLSTSHIAKIGKTKWEHLAV